MPQKITPRAVVLMERPLLSAHRTNDIAEECSGIRNPYAEECRHRYVSNKRDNSNCNRIDCKQAQSLCDVMAALRLCYPAKPKEHSCDSRKNPSYKEWAKKNGA